LHPEADEIVHRPTGLAAAQLVQARVMARLLPRTDLFHFYFGLTLVPKRVQFPLLRAFGKRSVFHFLGSDIRGKSPEELAYGRRAGAQIVGSFAARRWVPEAHVIPPGIDLERYREHPPTDRDRPLVVHAPSSRTRKGTEHVIAACARLPVDLRLVEGLPHEQARRLYEDADIVIDQLNAGWYGVFAIEAMALGKPVLTYLQEEPARATAEAFGLDVPIVSVTADTLHDRLAPLVTSVAERRRLGAASRAYVERVHGVEPMTDRLLEVYASL
jgi:glycosyltransferase involved in cell wall biosynthesis